MVVGRGLCMKTRVAVVGSGFGLYGQLPAFQRIPDCEVVGIAGRNSDRLLNYCRQTNVPAFADWRSMLDQARPEAIAIAVVPSRQYEIASEALDRGLSVFAEKPLALDLAQATALLEKARAKKVAHMVDFLFPEIPEWRRARQILEEGAVGRLHSVHVRWLFRSYDHKNNIQGWKTCPKEGGGALSFYVSHVFYNLEHFFGKIESLKCKLHGSPPYEETHVRLDLTFCDGGNGVVEFWCDVVRLKAHSWSVLCDTGALLLDNTSSSFTRGFEITQRSKLGATSSKIVVQQTEADPAVDERVPLIKSLAERFIAWHRGGPPSHPDFSDGVRVQHLIECARKSAATNERQSC